MNNESKNYYDLNKRALEFRNSKEYFIGDRVCRYINLIKHLHFVRFFIALFDDMWRVIFNKKSNPTVDLLEFNGECVKDRIAVYTAVYGNYDEVLEPLYADPMCDYYIFTDLTMSESSIWKKIEFDDFPIGVNSGFLKNRYVKTMPHKIFKEYKYSIYIDGNLQITSQISTYLKNFNTAIGIGMHKHPSNKGIFEEVNYNVKLKKIKKEEGIQLKKMYKKKGMPDNYGMFECNVIMREHFNENCVEIMEEWWYEIVNGIKRDQLYFTYVLYKKGYKFEDLFLLGQNINANPMFIRYDHR